MRHLGSKGTASAPNGSGCAASAARVPPKPCHTGHRSSEGGGCAEAAASVGCRARRLAFATALAAEPTAAAPTSDARVAGPACRTHRSASAGVAKVSQAARRGAEAAGSFDAAEGTLDACRVHCRRSLRKHRSSRPSNMFEHTAQSSTQPQHCKIRRSSRTSLLTSNVRFWVHRTATSQAC